MFRLVAMYFLARDFFEGFKTAKPSVKAKLMQNVILMYVNTMQIAILINVRRQPLFTV